MSVPKEIESRLRRVSSRQNALVKDLRKALSQGEPTAEGYLAIEGVRMIEEAIRSGLRFQAVFFSEAGSAHATRLLPQIGSQVEILLLPDEVFVSAVSTESPQGVAALVKLRPHKFEDLLESAADSLLVGVAGIQDPGKSWHDHSLRGSLRRARRSAGRKDGQPLQSQDRARLRRIVIPPTAHQSETW